MNFCLDKSTTIPSLNVIASILSEILQVEKWSPHPARKPEVVSANWIVHSSAKKKRSNILIMNFKQPFAKKVNKEGKSKRKPEKKMTVSVQWTIEHLM